MPEHDRRQFLKVVKNSVPVMILGPVALAQTTIKRDHRPAQERKEAEPEVTVNEDLMREHGVLRRVLLVYDEVVRRLGGDRLDFDPKVIVRSADVVRKFVEDYHERLEENHLFPRLRAAGQLAALVDTLLQQHRVGRVLTDQIRSYAESGLRDKVPRQRLQEAIGKFQHMYRPHAAREDTVLFPAFKRVVSRNEYYSLGDEFEKIERRQFGKDGFETVLHEVEGIEQDLGISDLARFTPSP